MNSKFIPSEREVTHEVADEELPPAPKKILILDDDPGLTEILSEFLETEEFKVSVVKSGVEGIKKVMAEKYDVIVCDMLMPSMPGDMFYKAVERAKPELTKRFIFMTGHKGDPKIDQFIRSVRGLVIWKPFELHQLLEAIHGILRKAGSGNH